MSFIIVALYDHLSARVIVRRQHAAVRNTTRSHCGGAAADEAYDLFIS